MNVFTFTGHLGKDAELKQGQNGNRLTFSVAVQSGYGDNQKTTWANCVIFGKRADGQLINHLKTGQKVAIDGELTLEKWTNQQQVEQQALKVIVNGLDLIGGQNTNGAQSNNQAPQQQAPAQQGWYQQPAPVQQAPVQQQPQSAPQPATTALQAKGFDDFDDDIPFANPYQFAYHIV